MIDEIFRTYLLILFHAENETKRLIISKDILEVSSKLLKRLDGDTKGTIFWNKMRLLNLIAKQYNEGVNIDIALGKLFSGETKFSALKDEVMQIKTMKTTEMDILHLEKQLTFEKQYIISEEYLQRIKGYIERIENRDFEGVEDIETELKNIIEQLYMGFIRETNLARSLDGVKVIDYNDPDILLSKMQEFYSGKNYISSGYKNLDDLLGGGFERTRLYLLAGKPGSGKSTFLLNFAYNMSQEIAKEGLDEYVLYLSLENLALETNQRLLGRHLDLKKDSIESLIRTGDPNRTLRDALTGFKSSNLVISYFPARTFGTTDLFSYVETLNMERKQKPRAIIVDYLDLMKLPQYISEMRLQLGDITLGLKSLAVLHKIPVISATQLLKSSYNTKPGLGDIKESSEKIDHSDAIGLINRLDKGDDLEEHIDQFGFNVELSWDKSRASANGTLRFAMILSKFLIEMERDNWNNKKPKNALPPQQQAQNPYANSPIQSPMQTKFSPPPPMAQTDVAFMPPVQSNNTPMETGSGNNFNDIEI